MKQPSDRLLEVDDVNTGFRVLLNDDFLLETSGFGSCVVKFDWINRVMRVLASLVDCRRHYSEMLLPLARDVITSKFATDFLTKYARSIETEASERAQGDYVTTIRSLVTFVNFLLDVEPAKSLPLRDVISSFKTVNDLNAPDSNGSVIARSLTSQDVDDVIALLRRFADEQKKQKQLKGEVAHAPLDDFRSIPVMPSFEDLSTRPQLRPIKALGAYGNLQDYLDINFRLLREDFLRPLRDGVRSFVQQQQPARAGAKKIKVNKDVRIYRHVSVLHSVVSHRDGLCFRIEVRMTNRQLHHISSPASKRLIFGALLCLSPEVAPFQEEVIFATIVNRDSELIADGRLDIKIESDVTDPGKLVTTTYIMAESSAYFEAYRHVLASLKEIDDKLPFQKHLVKVETDVTPPRYVTKNEEEEEEELIPVLNRFDMTRLVQKPKPKIDEKAPRFDRVKITDEDTWPSEEQLGLNESQYEAFRLTMTHKLALIQGPPGTGKTYLGLKIVRGFLDNPWYCERAQILVVCYTNHALDQFLEGVLAMGILDDRLMLRVGSRSKSEALEWFNIRSWRRRRDIDTRFNGATVYYGKNNVPYSPV